MIKEYISSTFLEHSQPNAAAESSVYGIASFKNRKYLKHYFVKTEDFFGSKAGLNAFDDGKMNAF